MSHCCFVDDGSRIGRWLGLGVVLAWLGSIEKDVKCSVSGYLAVENIRISHIGHIGYRMFSCGFPAVLCRGNGNLAAIL